MATKAVTVAKQKKTKTRVVPRWLVIVGVIGLLAVAGGLTYRVISPIQEGQRLVAEATALAETDDTTTADAQPATSAAQNTGGILGGAAADLGVSVADLQAAIGDTRPIDYDAAAEALGLPAAEIEAAILNNRPGAANADTTNPATANPQLDAIVAGAAAELGIAEADLRAAIGTPEGRPDFETAASQLGITTEALQTAWRNNRPADAAAGAAGQANGAAGGGNAGGRAAMIAGVAAELGISEDAVNNAFGEGRPDIPSAAAALGVSEEALQSAVQNNRPAGAGGGGGGPQTDGGQGQAGQTEQGLGGQIWDAVLQMNPFAGSVEDAVIDPNALVYADVVTLNATETVEGSGTLNPIQTDSVTWATTGRIGEVLVQVGDFVTKGQVLMTVDPESYSDTIINAENALLDAQIALAALLEDADPLEVIRAQEAIVLAEDALLEAEDTLADLGVVDHDYYQEQIADAQSAVNDAIEARDTAIANVESAQRDIAAIDLQAQGLALDAEKAQRALDQTILSAEQQGALVELGALVDALRSAEAELVYTMEQQGHAQAAHNDNCQTRAADDTLAPCRTTDAVHQGRSIDQWNQSVLDVQRKVDKAELDLDIARQSNQQIYDDAAFTARENAATVAENTTANANSLANAQTTLDARQASVADAEAAIVEAQEAVADIEADYAFAQDGPDSRDVDLARLAVEVAKAEVINAQQVYTDLLAGADETEVAQAEARIRAAEAALDKLELKAPYDSTVMEVNYLAGSNINTTGAAVQVADLTTLLITLAVDETDISRMQLGQTATLTFDAILNETFNGEVTAIAPFGQDDGGIIRYDVEIQLRDEDPRLLVGMTTNARIVTNELVGVVAVPLDAVLLDSEGEYVLVLNPATGAHDRVDIVTGIIEGTFIVIERGALRAGQQVLIEEPVATVTGAPQAPGGGGLLGGFGRGGGGR